MGLSLTRPEMKLLLAYMTDPKYVECPRIVGLQGIRKKLARALRPIKVSSAKDKGRELQKWVCQRVACILGVVYDQGDDQCPVHSREMGQPGSDVVIRGPDRGRFPFSVECKSTESFSLSEAVDQARANQAPETYWLVVHKRRSFRVPVVVLDWFAFEEMVSGWGPKGE